MLINKPISVDTDKESELILEDLHNKMEQIIKNQNKIINMLNEDNKK